MIIEFGCWRGGGCKACADDDAIVIADAIVSTDVIAISLAMAFLHNFMKNEIKARLGQRFDPDQDVMLQLTPNKAKSNGRRHQRYPGTPK